MRKWGEPGLRHWLNYDSESFAWLVALAAVAVGLMYVGWR